MFDLTQIEFGPNQYSLTYEDFKTTQSTQLSKGDEKVRGNEKKEEKDGKPTSPEVPFFSRFSFFARERKEFKSRVKSKETLMSEELRRVYGVSSLSMDDKMKKIIEAMHTWWTKELKMSNSLSYTKFEISTSIDFKDSLEEFYRKFRARDLSMQGTYPNVLKMSEGIYLNLKFNSDISLETRKSQFINLVVQFSVCGPGRYNSFVFTHDFLTTHVSMLEFLKQFRRGIVEKFAEGKENNDPNAVRKYSEGMNSHDRLALLRFAQEQGLNVYTSEEFSLIVYDQHEHPLNGEEKIKFWNLWKQKHTPAAAFYSLLGSCSDYVYRKIEELKPISPTLSRQELINTIKNIFLPINPNLPEGLLTLIPGVECDLDDNKPDLLPSAMTLQLQDRTFVKIVTREEFRERLKPYVVHQLVQAGVFNGKNGDPPQIHQLKTGATLYTFETKASSGPNWIETKGSICTLGPTWIKTKDSICTLAAYVTEEDAQDLDDRIESIPSDIWTQYLVSKMFALANIEAKDTNIKENQKLGREIFSELCKLSKSQPSLLPSLMSKPCRKKRFFEYLIDDCQIPYEDVLQYISNAVETDSTATERFLKDRILALATTEVKEPSAKEKNCQEGLKLFDAFCKFNKDALLSLLKSTVQKQFAYKSLFCILIDEWQSPDKLGLIFDLLPYDQLLELFSEIRVNLERLKKIRISVSSVPDDDTGNMTREMLFKRLLIDSDQLWLIYVNLNTYLVEELKFILDNFGREARIAAICNLLKVASLNSRNIGRVWNSCCSSSSSNSYFDFGSSRDNFLEICKITFSLGMGNFNSFPVFLESFEWQISYFKKEYLKPDESIVDTATFELQRTLSNGHFERIREDSLSTLSGCNSLSFILPCIVYHIFSVGFFKAILEYQKFIPSKFQQEFILWGLSQKESLFEIEQIVSTESKVEFKSDFKSESPQKTLDELMLTHLPKSRKFKTVFEMTLSYQETEEIKEGKEGMQLSAASVALIVNKMSHSALLKALQTVSSSQVWSVEIFRIFVQRLTAVELTDILKKNKELFYSLIENRSIFATKLIMLGDKLSTAQLLEIFLSGRILPGYLRLSSASLFSVDPQSKAMRILELVERLSSPLEPQQVITLIETSGIPEEILKTKNNFLFEGILKNYPYNCEARLSFLKTSSIVTFLNEDYLKNLADFDSFIEKIDPLLNKAQFNEFLPYLACFIEKQANQTSVFKVLEHLQPLIGKITPQSMAKILIDAKLLQATTFEAVQTFVRKAGLEAYVSEIVGHARIYKEASATKTELQLFYELIDWVLENSTHIQFIEFITWSFNDIFKKFRYLYTNSHNLDQKNDQPIQEAIPDERFYQFCDTLLEKVYLKIQKPSSHEEKKKEIQDEKIRSRENPEAKISVDNIEQEEKQKLLKKPETPEEQARALDQLLVTPVENQTKVFHFFWKRKQYENLIAITPPGSLKEFMVEEKPFVDLEVLDLIGAKFKTCPEDTYFADFLEQVNQFFPSETPFSIRNFNIRLEVIKKHLTPQELLRVMVNTHLLSQIYGCYRKNPPELSQEEFRMILNSLFDALGNDDALCQELIEKSVVASVENPNPEDIQLILNTPDDYAILDSLIQSYIRKNPSSQALLSLLQKPGLNMHLFVQQFNEESNGNLLRVIINHLNLQDAIAYIQQFSKPAYSPRTLALILAKKEVKHEEGSKEVKNRFNPAPLGSIPMPTFPEVVPFYKDNKDDENDKKEDRVIVLEIKEREFDEKDLQINSRDNLFDTFMKQTVKDSNHSVFDVVQMQTADPDVSSAFVGVMSWEVLSKSLEEKTTILPFESLKAAVDRLSTTTLSVEFLDHYFYAGSYQRFLFDPQNHEPFGKVVKFLAEKLEVKTDPHRFLGLILRSELLEKVPGTTLGSAHHLDLDVMLTELAKHLDVEQLRDLIARSQIQINSPASMLVLLRHYIGEENQISSQDLLLFLQKPGCTAILQGAIEPREPYDLLTMVLPKLTIEHAKIFLEGILNLPELSPPAFIAMLEALKDLSGTESEKSFLLLDSIFKSLTNQVISTKLMGYRAEQINGLFNPILRHREVIPENSIKTCVHLLEKYVVKDAGSNLLRIIETKRAQYYLLLQGVNAEAEIIRIHDETKADHDRNCGLINHLMGLTHSRLGRVFENIGTILRTGIVIPENKCIKGAIILLIMLLWGVSIAFTAGASLAIGWGIGLYFFAQMSSTALYIALGGGIVSFFVSFFATIQLLKPELPATAWNNLPYQPLDLNKGIVAYASGKRDDLYHVETGFIHQVVDHQGQEVKAAMDRAAFEEFEQLVQVNDAGAGGIPGGIPVSDTTLHFQK